MNPWQNVSKLLGKIFICKMLHLSLYVCVWLTSFFTLSLNKFNHKVTVTYSRSYMTAFLPHLSLLGFISGFTPAFSWFWKDRLSSMQTKNPWWDKEWVENAVYTAPRSAAPSWSVLSSNRSSNENHSFVKVSMLNLLVCCWAVNKNQQLTHLSQTPGQLICPSLL